MKLTETKIANQACCNIIMGYNVVWSPMSTMAAEGAQGVVCVVIRDRPQGWIIEAAHFHKTNMVSCKVITDIKWTPIVVA